ncbi:MAG: FHA domain-containing protein [Desulfobacterales bacterium]|nr:FHA domain-containing protein [Desulfobacterales bacterium]
MPPAPRPAQVQPPLHLNRPAPARRSGLLLLRRGTGQHLLMSPPSLPNSPASRSRRCRPRSSFSSGPRSVLYKELPIVIGKKADSDFVLNHPALSDHHAQIFFSQNMYWIKDLSGRSLITIGGSRIGFEAPLKAQDVISLAPGGPALRFLGEGRLAEYEEAPAEESPVPAEIRSVRACKKGKALEVHLRHLQEVAAVSTHATHRSAHSGSKSKPNIRGFSQITAAENM